MPLNPKKAYQMPVSYNDIKTALDVAAGVQNKKILTRNPESREINIFDEDTGGHDTYILKDTFLTRFYSALGTAFPDTNKHLAVASRFNGMSTMLRTDRAQDWIVYEHGEMMVADAILKAAAICPVRPLEDEDDTFNEDTFFKLAEEFYEQENQ